MQNVNFLAVLGATVAAALAGALWFSPLLFVKIWMLEGGMGEVSCKTQYPALLIGTAFFLNFLTAFALAVGLGHQAGLIPGLEAGLIVGVFWVGTSVAMNHLFEGKSFKFFCISAGYHVFRFALIGLILGIWN